MTTIEYTTISSNAYTTQGDHEELQGSRRSLAFGTMLVLAAVLVLIVLVGATVLPVSASIVLSIAALALVAISWIVAGPRV